MHNWGTDMSPAVQKEIRRKSELSPRLQQLEVEAFSQQQLKDMLTLSGLGPTSDFERNEALRCLEKSVKTHRRKHS